MVINLENRVNPSGNDCLGESHIVEGTVCSSGPQDVTKSNDSCSELNKDAIV